MKIIKKSEINYNEPKTGHKFLLGKDLIWGIDENGENAIYTGGIKAAVCYDEFFADLLFSLMEEHGGDMMKIKIIDEKYRIDL